MLITTILEAQFFDCWDKGTRAECRGWLAILAYVMQTDVEQDVTNGIAVGKRSSGRKRCCIYIYTYMAGKIRNGEALRLASQGVVLVQTHSEHREEQ